ncbi:MAG: LysE family transporter [Chloroflexi bacterium]|nr:LysE family transporter [Chloroflexota bacterium]
MFLTAFLLGLAYCAPPGAVFAETLRRGARAPSARRAFDAALRVQVGSVLGDIVWAAVALVGAAFLVQNEIARIALGALGTLLMAWLAWSALRDAWHSAAPSVRAHSALGPFHIGLLLALGNPFAVPFWLGLGAGSLAQLNAQPRPIDLVLFFGAFIAATIVYAFTVAALTGYGRRFLNVQLYRTVNLLCGIFLAWKAIELAITLFATTQV